MIDSRRPLAYQGIRSWDAGETSASGSTVSSPSNGSAELTVEASVELSTVG
jgi:hypothetical protein